MWSSRSLRAPMRSPAPMPNAPHRAPSRCRKSPIWPQRICWRSIIVIALIEVRDTALELSRSPTNLPISLTEIELDKTRTWCPRAGCETICMVGAEATPAAGDAATATGTGTATQTATATVTAASTGSAICQMDESPSTSQSYTPQQDAATPLLSLCVHCPSCKEEFCALCKKAVSRERER